MKKVLLITNTYSIFDRPIRLAFLSLGLEVQSVDYWGNAVLMPGRLIHKFVNRLPPLMKNRIRSHAQWHIDSKIISTAKSFKPDLIFVLKAKDIRPQTLKKLRTIAKLANYYPETFDHWERIKRISQYYDYFFNYDSEVVKRLKETGYTNAYYLPFSAEIDQNAIFPDFKQRKYAVSFVGSFMSIRYTQRETILSQIKDLGLNIWGSKAWLDTGLKEYYRGRPETEEMFDIYRKSKIVVNIDLMLGVDGTGVNLRPFEVTSCGAMLLNHDDRKDIFNLFEEGKEFMSFKGPDDIREKVEYFLNHQDELEGIARAGFEKTKSKHSYLSRIQEVIKIVSS